MGREVVGQGGGGGRTQQKRHEVFSAQLPPEQMQLSACHQIELTKIKVCHLQINKLINKIKVKRR